MSATEINPTERTLRQKWLLILPVLIPLVILVWTGIHGINFGNHPDEGNKIGEVRRMLDKGIFIPTFYKKPSVIYYTVLLSIVPDIPAIVADASIAEEVDRAGDQPVQVLPVAATYATNDNLLLRVRSLSLIITSLSVVWTYLLVLNWRDNWLEALLAASFLGLSWETAYHLRWIAADGYILMFVVLSYLYIWLYHNNSQKRQYLWWAAIAAGFAVSSKYNVGLILIPLLIVVYWHKSNWADLFKTWRNMIGVFVLAYLLITPGTILAPEHFIRGVVYEVTHYAEGHRNYSVIAGLPHLLKNIEYLSTVFFSPYVFVALPFFLVGGFGIYAIYKEDRRWLILLLSFPLIYLLYMSTQNVMFVRNLMPLFPILAILSARGVMFIVERINSQPVRYAIGAVVLVALALNTYWLVDAAQRINERIVHPLKDPFFDDFIVYVEDNPDQVFSVTHDVWFSWVADRQLEAPENIRRIDWTSDDVDFMVISQNELRQELPVGERGMFFRSYHQNSYNIAYYPSLSGESWAGERRVILIPIDVAHRLNLTDIWDEKYGDSDG